MSTPANSAKDTIGDFHVQWTRFQRQDGVYASEDFFWDYFGPLLKKDHLLGKDVAEIGCGNGRFVKIFSSYARRAVGFEPSGAVEVAKSYCGDEKNTEFYKKSVYEIEGRGSFDTVMCLGVLHHLPDPVLALKIMKSMLKSDGVCLVWVYGKEGNELYLKIFKPLMEITSRLPHWLLHVVAFILAVILKGYIFMVSIFDQASWPLKNYIHNVSSKLDFYHLKLVIYDQLNPRIANYYSRSEIESLARQAGFSSLIAYHRHGYSWTLKLK